MTIGGRGEHGIFGEKLARQIAALSFAFLLFLPVSQGTVLIYVAGICTVIAILTALVTGRALTRPVAVALLLTMTLGAYGLFVGASNPGFWNAAMIFLLTPAIFFLYVSVLGDKVIKDLVHTCAIVTIALGAVILAYVGTQTGVLDPKLFPSWFLDLVGAGYGEKGDTSAVRFYGLSTLAAAAPMWVASLLVGRDSFLPSINIRLAAAVLGIGGAMVGGRRAIVLGLLLVPVIVWAVRMVVKRKDRTGARTYPPGAVIGAIIGLAIVTPMIPTIAANPAITNVIDSVSYYFSGTAHRASDDEAIRAGQIDGLMNYWAESPVFGRGLGASVPGLVRSQNQPWQFETQYPALLMQVGLVGMLIIAALSVVVVWAVARASASRPSMRPTLIVTLTGGVSMLIANATNPYLQAPAHHWTIFLPLAVINYMLREPEFKEPLVFPLDYAHGETAAAQLGRAHHRPIEPSYSGAATRH